MGIKKDVYNIILGRPEGKQPIRRPTQRRKFDNTVMISVANLLVIINNLFLCFLCLFYINLFCFCML